MSTDPTRQAAITAVLDAKRRLGLTHAEVAEAIGRPKVWTAAALTGQHPFPPETIDPLAACLELDAADLATLTSVPWRGSFDPTGPPTDPTVYRLYEIVQVYGPALKELIHEEFGDGIMSAITFNVEFSETDHPGGKRVHIELDGKYLQYTWD